MSVVINHTHFADTGCQIWMKCQLCPLDICVDDVLNKAACEWVRLMAYYARDAIISNCDAYLTMVNALIELKKVRNSKRNQREW